MTVLNVGRYLRPPQPPNPAAKQTLIDFCRQRGYDVSDDAAEAMSEVDLLLELIYNVGLQEPSEPDDEPTPDMP